MKQDRLQSLIATGMASSRHLDEAGEEAVLAAKTSGELAWFRAPEPTLLGADDESRSISYVYSDETQDRYGDVIRAAGWSLTHYRTNPVALWQHDMDQPIGVSTEVAPQAAEKRLVGTIGFAEEGTTPISDMAYKLAKQRVLRAVSVGFDPLDIYSPKDKEEREALNLGRYGVEIRAAELLEISLVSIPANPSAMQLSCKQLLEAGELTEGEYELARRTFTEMDWEKRARAVRRRSVVVPELPSGATGAASQPDISAVVDKLDQLITEQRELRQLVTELRGRGGAEHPDADGPDAQTDPLEAAMRATEELALKQRFSRLSKETVSALGGAK